MPKRNRFKASPDDHMVVVKWDRGELTVNQRWLETTSLVNLRKFLKAAVKLQSTGRIRT